MGNKAENNITAGTEDREIVATRVFNAPRELVFQMWTDPKHIAQRWGPRGFTTTIHEMDVRPGGVWRLTMQMLFKTAEERNQVAEKYGAVEGLNQTMDKLGEYLARV